MSCFESTSQKVEAGSFTVDDFGHWLVDHL